MINVVVVLVMCLHSNGQCTQVRPMIEEVPITYCTVVGQRLAAMWLEGKPGYYLAAVRCLPKGEAI